MVEVTNSNFIDILSDFKYALEKCSFVAIDCEFSALPSYVGADDSFLDSPEERYKKIKKDIDKCLIIQVGVTPFKYDRNLNHFKAFPYNFYVFPRKFGSYDVNMVCSSSTINFLCDSSFDFNKVFYHGVSYMKNSKLQNIHKMIKDGTLLDRVKDNLSYTEVEEIIEKCDRIRKWIGSSQDNTLQFDFKENNPALNFVMIEEIRKIDKSIWCSEENGKIVVFKVSSEKRIELEKLNGNPAAQDKFLTSLKGFSRIYETLSSSKKPLVGHNLFNDLLIMFHQFHGDLPDSYMKYKKCLHEIFPHVYDTKFISIELGHLKNSDNKNSSLPEIFKSYQDSKTLFYFPQVVLGSKGIYDSVDAQHSHDAGWDSYMTGFIFLKMADELVRISKKETHLINVMSAELFNHVKSWENKIKIARCKVTHLNLAANDPISKRPPLLLVKSLTKPNLRRDELDAVFKNYEPIYKKNFNLNSALIATPNFSCFKKILLDFHESKEFKIEKYSLIKHHKGVQSFIAAGLVFPIIISLWFGFMK